MRPPARFSASEAKKSVRPGMRFLLGIPKQIYLFIRALITFLAATLFLALKTNMGRIVLGVSVVLVAVVGVYRFLFPPLLEPIQVFDLIWLNQGWTEDQRETYYHTSQGTLVIPYSWFFALERPPKLS